MQRPRRSFASQLRADLPYLWRSPVMWVLYAFPLFAYLGGMATLIILLGALISRVLWRTIAQTRFVGPLFYYDLVRLARRGRSTSARVLYVLGLLVVLVFLFYARFSNRGEFSTMLFEAGPSVSINEMSNMGEWFVANVIILQNLAGEDQAAAAADRDYRRQVGVAPESDERWEKSIRKTRALPTLPAVGERPLLWKEWHISGRPMPFADFMWGMMLLVSFPLMVFYGFLLIGAGTRQESDQIGIFRFLTTAVAGYSCVEIAYRTCVSVVKERQRQTLDGLLTLPVSAVEILQAKWLGGVARGWGWIVYMAMILALAAAGGAIHWGAALLLMFAWAVHASFVASLGLFVSVVSRTVLIAQVRMALALFLLLTVAGVTYELFGNQPDGFRYFVFNLCPPVCWYRLGSVSSLQDGLFDGMGLSLILMGLLIYGLAAWVLWLLARRWFGPA